MSTQKFAKLLGWISLAVVAAILYLGLWPYNVRMASGAHWQGNSKNGVLGIFPPNNVAWLKDGAGLRFGKYGSIFSKTDFTATANQTEGCTIEVWLEPAVTEDFTTTLAFSTETNRLQFRLRQQEDALYVSHDTPGEKQRLRRQRIWIDHVFQQGERVLVALTSGPNGTAVYLNGKLRQRYENFRLRSDEFTGRMIFGDSPMGHDTWGGTLLGLAIYQEERSAGQVGEDFRKWNTGDKSQLARVHSPRALYLFEEGNGRVAHSAVAGAPDLEIPETFQTLRPRFLQPFWTEYTGDSHYFVDIFLNIAAFVPLGFFLRGYLKIGAGIRRDLLTTAICGFALSLTIEVGQYYLPMRNSGTTDLITNTTGAILGGMIFGTAFVQTRIRALRLD